MFFPHCRVLVEIDVDRVVVNTLWKNKQKSRWNYTNESKHIFLLNKIYSQATSLILACAQRMPSSAADTMPPAYPAPSPQGIRP